MLILEYIDKHGRPVQVEAGRLLVRDGVTKTPIMFGAAISSGQNLVAHALDDEFQTILREHRIKDTVLVTSLTAGDLPAPTIRGS